jgi:transcriptional regulator with XRE-family HTH domain
VFAAKTVCYSGDMAQKIVKTREIGAAIRKRRKELGWSQEQLAEKVGVTFQQMQRYENGSTMLNVENVQRIAAILGLPVADFFASDSSLTVEEPVEFYFATDEKALLRHYRAITVVADRKLAVKLLKRLTKK